MRTNHLLLHLLLLHTVRVYKLIICQQQVVLVDWFFLFRWLLNFWQHPPLAIHIGRNYQVKCLHIAAAAAAVYKHEDSRDELFHRNLFKWIAKLHQQARRWLSQRITRRRPSFEWICVWKNTKPKEDNLLLFSVVYNPHEWTMFIININSRAGE